MLKKERLNFSLIISFYVEIKCQLDEQRILLQIFLFAQHVSGTTMPIVRSSIVRIMQWLLPVVFRAVVF